MKSPQGHVWLFPGTDGRRRMLGSVNARARSTLGSTSCARRSPTPDPAMGSARSWGRLTFYMSPLSTSGTFYSIILNILKVVRIVHCIPFCEDVHHNIWVHLIKSSCLEVCLEICCEGGWVSYGGWVPLGDTGDPLTIQSTMIKLPDADQLDTATKIKMTKQHNTW